MVSHWLVRRLSPGQSVEIVEISMESNVGSSKGGISLAFHISVSVEACTVRMSKEVCARGGYVRACVCVQCLLCTYPNSHLIYTEMAHS